eukprot:14330918-Ditylum_brightwellii.AAC.1
MAMATLGYLFPTVTLYSPTIKSYRSPSTFKLERVFQLKSRKRPFLAFSQVQPISDPESSKSEDGGYTV